MNSVMRFGLTVLVGGILLVPVVAIAEALDFGALAWLVAFVVVLLLASLVDREGFYGPREPSRRS
jgi:hypothetical protein